jgi:hypothetical protein
MYLALFDLQVDSPRIGFQHFGSALRRYHLGCSAARFAPEIHRRSRCSHHRDVVRFDFRNGFVSSRHFLSGPNGFYTLHQVARIDAVPQLTGA